MLLIRPGASHTSRAVHGGGVSPALGLGISPQPDEAILAPAGAPAVPDNPVISLLGGTVAHHLHRVVHGDVGVVVAAVIDAALVAAPPTGVDGDCERPDLGDVLHHGVLVIGGEHVVPGEADTRGHAVIVIGAVTGHSVTRGVWPLVLGHMSEELDVGVGELGDGAHAAPSAATGERVGSAGSHLLG